MSGWWLEVDCVVNRGCCGGWEVDPSGGMLRWPREGRGKESEPTGRRADGKRGVATEEGELMGGSPWTTRKVVVVEERGGRQREQLMEKKMGAGWSVRRRGKGNGGWPERAGCEKRDGFLGFFE